MLIYFSVRGRAAEQGIIFKFHFDPETSLKAFAHFVDGTISTFSDRFPTNSQGMAQFCGKILTTNYC